jgi:hypothetical protein
MCSENCNNRAHHLVLDGKDVLERAVEVLGPSVSSSHGVDQLGRNAQAIAPAPYAALQHVAHAQLTADLADIDCLALVLEAGSAGDDKKLGEAGQLGDDVFDNAVGKILLLWIGTQIGKGEDGEGGLVREGQARSRGLRRGASFCQACGLALFAHGTHETEAPARQRLDQALLLAAVADRASNDVAGGHRRVGDDAAVPDGGDEVVLADHALAVGDQVSEHIEHLRRNGNRVHPATQLSPVGVEHAILEEITQAAVPISGIGPCGPP